jgi:4'-phosphopantetheinyl transferase
MNDITIASTWPDAPAGRWKPALTAGGIDLWLAELDRATRLAELAATLTADERDRAARFRFPEHRDRFIAGRGLLRHLLAAYLNRPAAALRFAAGPHGKPALAGEAAEAGLRFNLSHSGGQALYAVARRDVGVDVERLDRVVNYAAILDRICAPYERALFQARPPGREREAFFACWTRKEAMAKALGGGLASGLCNLAVCFRDEMQPDGRTCWSDAAGQAWSVLNLPLGPDWSGALAAAGVDWRWRGWRLGDGFLDPIQG